jgi:hypothetical protein
MNTCIHKVHTPNLRGHSTDRPTDRQDGVGANIYDLIIPLELRLGMGASEERRALGFCTGRVANHSEGAAWKVGNPALTFHYNNQPGHLLTISLGYCSSLSFYNLVVLQAIDREGMNCCIRACCTGLIHRC